MPENPKEGKHRIPMFVDGLFKVCVISDETSSTAKEGTID
jgi:hypothetical protein